MYKIKNDYKNGTYCVFDNYKIIESYNNYYRYLYNKVNFNNLGVTEDEAISIMDNEIHFGNYKNLCRELTLLNKDVFTSDRELASLFYSLFENGVIYRG